MQKDVISDVFVGIWQNRSKLNSIKNIDNYLFISIKNQAYRHIRDNNQHQSISIEKLQETELVNNHSPEQEMLYEEMRQMIEMVINSLPNRCRLIFTLIRGEKKTYREVAELLSISEKTVHAQMCIAIKRLREIIKEYI